MEHKVCRKFVLNNKYTNISLIKYSPGSPFAANKPSTAQTVLTVRQVELQAYNFTDTRLKMFVNKAMYVSI